MLPRLSRHALLSVVAVCVLLAVVVPLAAQERPATAPPAPTAEDYARAETFLAPAISALVVGGSVSPTWLPDPKGAQWTVIASPNEPDTAKEALGNRLIAQDLVRAIETNTQPKCGMHDGRWTIEMIVATYESQRLNKPVDLPLTNRQHPLTLL